MPSNYYKAMSQIQVDEKMKEKIMQKLNEEKNKENKGVILMNKVRKVFTTLGAIAGIAVCGGAVYAGITGGLKIFNNKVDTEYANYAEEVKNKFVENEFSKLTLENIACDDAYLIFDYTLDIKELGKEAFDKIILDTTTGFELVLDNTVKIDEQEIKNYGNFSQTISYKITDTQAKVYQVADLTGMEIPKEFKLELSDFAWHSKTTSSTNEYIRINESLSMNVSKEKEMEKTEKIIPQNAKYSYEGLELEVEKIVKTPFESFIIIKTEENNTLNSRYLGTPDEGWMDLKLNIYDESGENIKTDIKSTSNLRFEDGTYYKDDEGNVVNLNYYMPNEDLFKNATIETYFVIATDNKLDEKESIKIEPYYLKYVNNEKYEEEYLNSLEWHEIKDGEYTVKNASGAELTINKVEVKDDRILFYYKANNLVSNENIFVRNSSRAFNYFYMDIRKTENTPGEYVTGIRLNGYQGASTKNYENGNTDETANIENYSDDAYLSDVSKLVFAIDLGDQAMIENLGNGFTVSLK